jgi:hypothetical protein
LPTTSFTGATAETSIADSDLVLIYDDSASALRKMTRTNFVAGIGGTNTPAFKAQVTSDQTGIGNNTWTKVTYNNEIFDTNSAYDQTTNYRFTVPSGQAGKYLIIANADIRSTTSARSKYIQLYKNGAGAGFAGNFLTSEYFQNDQANQVMVANILDLAVSDYVEVYVNSYSGGNHRVSGGIESYFCGFKLIGV